MTPLEDIQATCRRERPKLGADAPPPRGSAGCGEEGEGTDWRVWFIFARGRVWAQIRSSRLPFTYLGAFLPGDGQQEMRDSS